MSLRRRWALVEVALDPAEGHEQAGSRPALVVSNEPFNETSGLLTVLPITSMKERRQPQPWEILLPAAAAGNPLDSIIMPQQMRTVSATRVRRPFGRLTDPALRREVAGKMLLHLGFENLDDLADEP
jgi:mRNA interferase MazF